jgi:lauroyl/myristoyl acyltransferase
MRIEECFWDGMAAAAQACALLLGARITNEALSRLSACVYPEWRRRWAAEVGAQLPGVLPNADAGEVIAAFMRQQGYRHAHEILTGFVDHQQLGNEFVKCENLNEFETTFKQSGALLIGAHLGYLPWAAFGLEAAGFSTRLVMDRDLPLLRRPKVSSWLWRKYGDFARDEARVIRIGGAYQRILKALEAGALVCVMGDVRHRYEMEVPFLGSTACFTTGPYQVARESGAPAFLYRLRPVSPTGYCLEICERLDTCQPIELQVRRFADWLGSVVCDQPEAWCFLPLYLSILGAKNRNEPQLAAVREGMERANSG